MRERKIMLMYISQVSGHRYATLAVEKALKVLDKNARILNINIFHHTSPISEKIVNFLYMAVIKKMPWLWDYMYDNLKVKKKIDILKKIVHRINYPKLKRLFEKFMPEVIVCSQAYPCGLVADYKKYFKTNFKLVAVLTDFVPHAYWIYDTVDYYIAPSEEIKEELVKKGVREEKIKVFGIPISPKFSVRYDKYHLRKTLGFKEDIFTVLIMGGGQGLGPLDKIIEYLDRLDLELQIILVTGINKKLFGKINKKIFSFKQKIKLLGFTDNIEKLMAMADLIITKPGGITTAEALSQGLPMLIINPLPGQEMNNMRYLIRNGVALEVKKIEDIGKAIKEFFCDRGKLKTMSEKARAISHPNSSLEIAEFILSNT